jgi:hypothetical protein
MELKTAKQIYQWGNEDCPHPKANPCESCPAICSRLKEKHPECWESGKIKFECPVCRQELLEASKG